MSDYIFNLFDPGVGNPKGETMKVRSLYIRIFTEPNGKGTILDDSRGLTYELDVNGTVTKMNKATFCSTFSSSNTHARIILDPSVIYPSLTASDGTKHAWDRGGKYIYYHVRPVNQTGQVLYNNTGPRLDGIVVKTGGIILIMLSYLMENLLQVILYCIIEQII